MPTYEYDCWGCGRRFERRQSITEEPLRSCPECGGEVHRLVSGGAGFIVRGEGRSGGGGCSGRAGQDLLRSERALRRSRMRRGEVSAVPATIDGSS